MRLVTLPEALSGDNANNRGSKLSFPVHWLLLTPTDFAFAQDRGFVSEAFKVLKSTFREIKDEVCRCGHNGET